MYLCCVSSLSSFRSKLDFLRFFKVTPKSDKSPCTIVHGLEPNFTKNEKLRILNFYNFPSYIHVHGVLTKVHIVHYISFQNALQLLQLWTTDTVKQLHITISTNNIFLCIE